MLYLLPFAFKSWRDRRRNGRSHEEYQSIPETEPVRSAHRLYIENKAERLIQLLRSRNPSEATAPNLADAGGALKDDHLSGAPLTTIQTAQLASVFCFYWFIANWSVNASLKYTSIGSSTVLASTSGMQLICPSVILSSR